LRFVKPISDLIILPTPAAGKLKRTDASVAPKIYWLW